jgi:copper transport protein
MLAGLVFLGVYGTLASVPAQAHALLVESSPADGATVDKAPSEVLLTFTEAVDPLLTVVHVLDASGVRVEVGRTEIPGLPTRARVPLPPLPDGTYTVTWRTTSMTDGHTTVGTVAFGVGVPAVAPESSRSQTGVRPPTVVAISGRWLFYAGAVLLLGGAVVGLFVVATPTLLSVWALNVAWAIAALGLVLTIADQRATTRTSLSDLLQSSTGQKLQVQAMAVGLTWLAVCWVSLRPRRAGLVAVGRGASAVMLQRALSGHADGSTVPWFTVGVQWLHIASVGAWIGGLAWLLIALRRDDVSRQPGLAKRFSRVAASTLGLVALTGTLRAVDEVGSWNGLFDTSFGVTLLVKLGLFAGLVALGARSHFRHVAAAAMGRLVGLRRTVRAEVLLGVAALGATAVLAGLPPSASVAEASKLQRPPSVELDGSDEATSVRLRLVVSPGAAGPNHFDATVVDYDSRQPVAVASVSLRLQPKDRPDVAASTVALTRSPDSHWQGFSSALSTDGPWTITAMVQSATDAVEVPMELTTR